MPRRSCALLLAGCGAFGTAGAGAGDAGVADATSADSGFDGGEASDGPGGAACAKQTGAAFCSDFEDSSTLPFGWTEQLDNDGTLERTATGGMNGSAGLRVSIPAASGNRHIALRKHLPGMAQAPRIDLELDFKVEKADLDYA